MVAHGADSWHQGDRDHQDDQQDGDVWVRVPLVGCEGGGVGLCLAEAPGQDQARVG